VVAFADVVVAAVAAAAAVVEAEGHVVAADLS